MAKDSVILWAFCSILCAFCSVTYGQTTRQYLKRRHISEIEARKKVISTAKMFVGITEKTNRNDGAVKIFQQPYGYKQGTHYCALGIWHCHMLNDIELPVKGFATAANWVIPRSEIIYNRGKYTGIPQAGDVALVSWGGKRIDHAEFVYYWNPDREEPYFYVIGFNVSDPWGLGKEGVFFKKRLKVMYIIVNKLTDYCNKTN